MNCSMAWAMTGRGWLYTAILSGAVAMSLVFGCRSSTPRRTHDDAALAEALTALQKPVSGDMAALYHLRIPSSGGLRLSILEASGEGRLTISEPFGAAVSMAEWGGPDGPLFLDLREGCRVPGGGLSAILGVEVMPLPQAVRLLAGRMPAGESDRVRAVADGWLEVVGDGWSARVTVADLPWRITEVEERTVGDVAGWKIRLEDHSGSLPGTVRVQGAAGRWAELELVRLQWDTIDTLPPLPALPRCGESEGTQR